MEAAAVYAAGMTKAIVFGYAGKRRALEAGEVSVADTPADVPRLLAERLARSPPHVALTS